MHLLLVKKISASDRDNPPSPRLPMKSSFDGRSDSLRQRFGRFCHFDAVGRFTSSAIFGFIMRRNELLLRIKKGASPSLVKDGRCMSENHVPIVAVSKEPKYTRCPFEGVGRPIANPRCPYTGRPVAESSRMSSTFRKRPLW